jgi:site-specific recombinase XerD
MRALPLLGPISDGFDDWLIARGYTFESRRCAIHMLPHIDAALRRRHRGRLGDISHATFHTCWRELIKVTPNGAGTALSLERYLKASGALMGDGTATRSQSPADALSRQYSKYLRDVRGLADSTAAFHEDVARCFLNHLATRNIPLRSVGMRDIESYITQVGKRISRASLQGEVSVVRGLLRYFSAIGRAPLGLDEQIDSPRLYQLEKLPRSLPWDMVTRILHSIDTTSTMGLRDHAMLLMIATYGLRACEAVALTLDDIHWRQGSFWIYQRKTSAPLELPLTNEVSIALFKHLKRNPPPAPYRHVFLRMRAPMGLLKPSAVAEVFQSAVRRSGLPLSFHGAHCLRHSLAMHLLKSGTSLKTIGDVLGHRTTQSTSAYIRLATGDLQEVSLPVPSIGGKRAR